MFEELNLEAFLEAIKNSSGHLLENDDKKVESKPIVDESSDEIREILDEILNPPS